MAVNSNNPITIEAGGTIEFYRLVKLSSGEAVHNTATETDVPIGVSLPVSDDEDFADGDQVPVDDIKAAGSQKVTAAGSITAGADIYAAADGKVQAVPTDSGTYRKVGTALQAASGDGEVIECWLNNEGDTTTVS